MPDWFPSLMSILSWLTVIVGWFVVGSDHRRRMATAAKLEARRVRRSEVRVALGTLNSRICEIIRIATEYHTKTDEGDAKRAQNIKMELKLLSLEIQAIPRFKTSELTDRYNTFKSAITGNDFECAKREKVSYSHRKLLEIMNCGFELTVQLEKVFNKSYPLSDLTD